MKPFNRLISGALLALMATVAFGAATSNFWQNKVVDQVFRAQTALTPANTYIALDTTAGSAQACGTEVSGGAYARQTVVSALANWSGTQGAGTTAASSNSSGSSGTTSNNNAITFPSPTANWGSIVGFCVFDASSGGNLLYYAPLTTPKTVNNGDAAPSFAAGALTFTIGDNGTPDWNKFMRELTEALDEPTSATA
jgi:hypothetical protein